MARVTHICVYDLDKERCLRQEKALEQALIALELDKRITAISNYGRGYITRAGIENQLPSLEVDGEFWCRKPNEELTQETITHLLATLIKKGIL